MREAGFVVETMAERYGEATGQKLGDPSWIEDAAAGGLAIFSKDKAIRVEHLDVVRECGAQVFLAPDAQAPIKDVIERYRVNRYRIAMRCNKSGPFIYMVRPAKLEHYPLD